MKYFTIEELTKSETAEEHGIDNTPTKGAREKLVALVDNVLDPLREMYGKPITVNSGYRGPVLNSCIGGEKTSQHVKGEAADITVGSKEGNKKLFDLIRDNLTFDQLINEYDYSWVHVSYKSSVNRKEVLKCVGGKYYRL